ncbi:LysR family transcriptional regulator [Paenibacillus sp. 1001270B_150601_E10]|uniref:LysR family transcriptional regulator n=1 Tax=Paenibacillus sp. 1001270B_150601_E10 TaxID=2787079 RepID=UPI00189F6DD5|nr:LysR family transcriptional regulator [Paenibacillus sp. 1001270B_150601_E10]
MDMRQLRYFITIVEEGNISAAAKKLHLSQPPLSQQLKAMELELGARLVERSGKRLEVTEAGRTLYQYALQMLQLMEEAKLEVQEVGNGTNGRLTLGVNTFSVTELPDLLQRFKAQYPKVTYHIQQNESSHLCKLVRDRVVELAVIRMPLDLEDFSVLHLYNEPFYFITSSQEDLYTEEVSLSDIQSCPLLLPSTQGLGVHYLILEAFSKCHLEPNIIGECSDISLLMDFVTSGFCASIVPETLLKRHEGYAIQAHLITSPTEMSAPVGLIWLKHHRLSSTAQNFIQMFEQEVLHS